MKLVSFRELQETSNEVSENSRTRLYRTRDITSPHCIERFLFPLIWFETLLHIIAIVGQQFEMGINYSIFLHRDSFRANQRVQHWPWSPSKLHRFHIVQFSGSISRRVLCSKAWSPYSRKGRKAWFPLDRNWIVKSHDQNRFWPTANVSV